MVTIQSLTSFALLAFAITLIPGPSALFIIGRSLSLGWRGGIVSVVGDSMGLIPQIALVAAGIGAVVTAIPQLFVTIRLLGACYLAYLGVQAIRHRKSGTLVDSNLESAAGDRSVNTWKTLRQGFLVGITNPKSTVFFVAVLPQFVVTSNGYVPLQMLILGGVFLCATLSVGSAIALIAGSARAWITRDANRMGKVNAAGGVMMVLLSGIVAALTFTEKTA